MLIINQNFNKSMEVGTEKCLLSRVCHKLTACLISSFYEKYRFVLVE